MTGSDKPRRLLLVVRPGAAHADFTRSLFDFASQPRTYEVTLHVSLPGEYEQDTLSMFVEKFKDHASYSFVVLVSPSSGFTPESIDAVVDGCSRSSGTKAYGLPVPLGTSTFQGKECVQNCDHARIMRATFQIFAVNNRVELSEDSSARVKAFQRDDIVGLPYNIASEAPDISRGYALMGESFECRVFTRYTTSGWGVSSCLLEQLKHVAEMRAGLQK